MATPTISRHDADHTTYTCGCRIQYNAVGVGYLEWCPTHALAPEMTEVLRYFAERADNAGYLVFTDACFRARALLARLDGSR